MSDIEEEQEQYIKMMNELLLSRNTVCLKNLIVAYRTCVSNLIQEAYYAYMKIYDTFIENDELRCVSLSAIYEVYTPLTGELRSWIKERIDNASESCKWYFNEILCRESALGIR